MSALSDKQILKYCRFEKMIEPFEETQIRSIGLGPEGFPDAAFTSKVISYGVSSYGYDIRLGNEFKIFTNALCPEVDPKNFDEESLVDVIVTDPKRNYILIPPNSFVLSASLEYIRMPKDCIAICMGKSTYARCGISINVTPLEPSWEGHITIEIANQSPCPARLYANEGIGQLLFIRGTEHCITTYADRKGKYQGQKGVTLPTV